MIPRILHRSWFHKHQASTPLNEKCWASFDRHLGDYQRESWSWSNTPDLVWLDKASPVNAASFMRYWSLYEFGGIHLDNDMEVLKSFDPLLDNECFTGWQRNDTQDLSINYSAMGSVKGHWYPKALMDYCLKRDPQDHPLVCGPIAATDVLRERGLIGVNAEQCVNGVKVYDRERFYPWWWEEKPDMARVTDRTFSIHWWEASWKK